MNRFLRTTCIATFMLFAVAAIANSPLVIECHPPIWPLSVPDDSFSGPALPFSTPLRWDDEWHAFYSSAGGPGTVTDLIAVYSAICDETGIRTTVTGDPLPGADVALRLTNLEQSTTQTVKDFSTDLDEFVILHIGTLNIDGLNADPALLLRFSEHGSTKRFFHLARRDDLKESEDYNLAFRKSDFFPTFPAPSGWDNLGDIGLSLYVQNMDVVQFTFWGIEVCAISNHIFQGPGPFSIEGCVN